MDFKEGHWPGADEFQPAGGVLEGAQTIIVATLLAPFAQAVSSTVGTRVANTIGPWTRLQLRRLLRRETRRHRVGVINRLTRSPLLLTHHNVVIILPTGIPADALALLPVMNFDDLSHHFDLGAAIVGWQDNRWQAHGARQGLAALSEWDPATATWTHRGHAQPD
ncbi:hypothetical protein [Streptomyces formicae]|uniref:Uncharacterized protein n=1 Tax=Streptomyces formicae TaxID=1616117 RepID=A0A291QIA8_9ACTN|nr:hypothetical protein [Streptomyces formicae]ATL31257.1 hypothetical protein KY5_6239 [Streptomyces formicae]